MTMCGSAADAAPGVERQPPLFGNRVTKGGRAGELHREPDAKARKPARQLRAMLTRIVEIVGMRHRRQIGGRRFVRGAKRRPVAHEQRAGAVGKEHALVRIERQRVGAGQAFERVAQVVAEREKCAVGAVDVVPQALARAEVRDLVERIDRAGVGRAGVRHHGKRQSAPGDGLPRSRWRGRRRRGDSDRRLRTARTRSGITPAILADFNTE